MRPGSRRDHDSFCRTEGWLPVRGATGKKVRHHVTYEFALPDGRILRARISRPVDTTTYGRSLWQHILREQLDVTEREFWDCVDEGQPLDRGAAPATPTDALPASVVWQLINEVGLPERDVAGMSLDNAMARLHEHWSRPAD